MFFKLFLQIHVVTVTVNLQITQFHRAFGCHLVDLTEFQIPEAFPQPKFAPSSVSASPEG